MRVRIIGLGTNWWSAHPVDVTDPFCFRRNAAWFNSSGLKCGNRLRLCWVFPGQVRFNSSSGFNPEFPHRALGRTVECNDPTRMNGRMHLLVSRLLDPSAPAEASLVAFTDRMCGQIPFNRPHWKSNDVRLISVSLRRDRYEVMALISNDGWIESALGIWAVSEDHQRLELVGGRR